MITVTEFIGTITEKNYLASDVLYLSFKVPPLFSFLAGQYVLVKVVQEEQLRWKSYSILNPPSERGKVDLCITIIEGGFASEVFKKVNVGEKMIFKGPLGHFYFDEQSAAQENWFICAGTGITPLYSMIKEYLPQYPGIPFVLLFGEKTQKDLLFHKELVQMEKKYPYFTYLPTLSREEWSGRKGRVQLHLPDDVQNKTFYLCGLKELVLETKELLLQKGVAPENIKFERYT